jgi:hypothetical protein
VTVIDHPAVAAYLARLDALAAHLPPARRQELRADLLEHLAEALPGDADDAQVRGVLDRLGPPEDIVGEEQAPPVLMPAPPTDTGLALETMAVLFLTIGSLLLPVIG